MTKDGRNGLDGVFARHDAALDAEQERLVA
jgi:hypothetical protein